MLKPQANGDGTAHRVPHDKCLSVACRLHDQKRVLCHSAFCVVFRPVGLVAFPMASAIERDDRIAGPSQRIVPAWRSPILVPVRSEPVNKEDRSALSHDLKGDAHAIRCGHKFRHAELTGLGFAKISRRSYDSSGSPEPLMSLDALK